MFCPSGSSPRRALRSANGGHDQASAQHQSSTLIAFSARQPRWLVGAFAFGAFQPHMANPGHTRRDKRWSRPAPLRLQLKSRSAFGNPASAQTAAQVGRCARHHQTSSAGQAGYRRRSGPLGWPSDVAASACLAGHQSPPTRPMRVVLRFQPGGVANFAEVGVHRDAQQRC